MNRFVERCLLNWRWWAVLPYSITVSVFMVLIAYPVDFLVFVLEVASDMSCWLQRELVYRFHQARIPLKWVFKKWEPKP